MAYYPLKGETKDYSKYSRELYSTFPKYTDGLYGAAMRIENNSSFGTPALDMDEWTISFWVRVSEGPGGYISSQVLRSYEDPYQASIHFSDHKITLYGSHYRHSSDRWKEEIDVPLEPNTWCHIAICHDKNNFMTIYFNSVMVRRSLKRPKQFPNLGKNSLTFDFSGTQDAGVHDVSDLAMFSQPHNQGAINVLAGNIKFRRSPRYNSEGGTEETSTAVVPIILLAVPIFACLAGMMVGQTLITRMDKTAGEHPPPHKRKTVAEIVQAINDLLRNNPNAKITRKDIGIDSTYRIHLDVGGEGYKKSEGYVSGFVNAININDKDKQTSPPYGNIPNLVKVADWGTNPLYPFADGFADYITMQGAPLTQTNVQEITRCLRPGGDVALWIDLNSQDDVLNNRTNITQLAFNLNSWAQFGAQDVDFDGRVLFDKTLIRSMVPPSDIFVMNPQTSEVEKIVVQQAVVSYKLKTVKGVDRLIYILHSASRHCGTIGVIQDHHEGHNELYFHSPAGVLDKETLNWEHCHYIHGENGIRAKQVSLRDVKSIAEALRGQYLDPNAPFRKLILSNRDCDSFMEKYEKFLKELPDGGQVQTST